MKLMSFSAAYFQFWNICKIQNLFGHTKENISQIILNYFWYIVSISIYSLIHSLAFKSWKGEISCDISEYWKILFLKIINDNGTYIIESSIRGN